LLDINGSKKLTAIGFGTSSDTLVSFGPIIDLFPSSGNFNEAPIMPRDGTLTSMYAYFSTTLAINIDLGILTGTLTCQLYTSPALPASSPATPSILFTPVSSAIVNLATFGPGVVTINPGTSFSGGVTPNVVIPAGARILMVFNVTGNTVLASFAGYASAGLNIV
jgi:BclB C-terminal domain-containing protein